MLSRRSFTWLTVCTASLLIAAGEPPSSRSKLNELIAEEWEFELRAQPEQATTYGDHRYDDRLSDVSWAGLTATATARRGFLQRVNAIAPAGLSEAEQLNQALLAKRLQTDIEWYEHKLDLLPINQLLGFHILPILWVKSMPFLTVKDYENYVSRLQKLPILFDQYMELAQAGARAQLVNPKFLMTKVIAQTKDLSAVGNQSLFAQPVAKFPAEITTAEQARLRAAVLTAIEQQVSPAYQKLARFVSGEYSASCRSEIGYSSLPEGEKLYRFLVRYYTTTELLPEQIHELGQKEITRIEAEMTALAKQQGHKDLKSFQAALKQDKRQFASSREQIIERYRTYIAQMEKKIPQYFGHVPKAPLIVTPLDPFHEKGMSMAAYFHTDGKRPGQVIVNTRDFAQQPLHPIEATAYHEGTPGHHLQYAVGLEAPMLPAFRRHSFYSAFQEGWALYAERFGKEAGFYQDAASDYGRLTSEIIRAVRLVVDTGLHVKHWSRQQAVDYFHQHTAMDDAYIDGEVDRYIVMPGQALSYKIGELKLLELRKRAEATLGAKFDIRAFHDQLLGNGELPLDVLEQLFLTWLAAQKR